MRRETNTHIGLELLSSFLDDEMTAGERSRVQDHLLGCQSCQAELESLRQTVTLLAALPRVPVPRAFTLSQAQVKRQGAFSPLSWLGGAARGLGAVAALALVALVAVTLLTPPRSTGPTIARIAAPTALPALTTSPAAVPMAPLQAPDTATVAEDPVRSGIPTAELNDVATSTAEPPVPAPLARAELAETASPQPSVQAKAQALAPTPSAGLTPTAEEEMMLAMAAEPAAEGTTVADAPGSAGAAFAGARSVIANTPAPLPPLASPADVLPLGAGVAIADQQGLWVLDGISGFRQVIQGEGISDPRVSDDRTWIVFRMDETEDVVLRAVRWTGDGLHSLVTESQLPSDGLDGSYSARQFYNLYWLPESHSVMFSTIATPKGTGLLSQFDLWRVDVDAPALQFIASMGTIDRLAIAPAGRQVAFLRTNDASAIGGQIIVADLSRGEHVVGEFPPELDPVNGNFSLSWLPDGSGVRLSVPLVDSSAGISGERTLVYEYSLIGSGAARIELAGIDPVWSPDGQRLAYAQLANGALGEANLMIASADGSRPASYASLRSGSFVAWSPDSSHFLYYADDQIYAGSSDMSPRRIGSLSDFSDAFWASPSLVLARHDQGPGWALVSWDLDGKVASLIQLTYDASFSIAVP